LDSGDGPFRDLLDDRSMWDESTVARGSRPLDYLRRLAAAPRSLVIHGNYLAQDEIAFVAARRESMSIVFCPRTHHYFRHEPYPLPQMLAAGVRVALGTDSRASNPDLDMLRELRFAAQRWSAVSPEAWLRMATLDAAAALGLAASAGSLEQGRRADLVAVPCPGADPYEQIVGGASPVAAVWLAGVRVR
ncbi:MAG TPA: amidohydrolase family protein, partial [Lacipirellulaceae bacterium]|nr:amidohydrolase family protein [Lacipirellulaceae bacterium]